MVHIYTAEQLRSIRNSMTESQKYIPESLKDKNFEIVKVVVIKSAAFHRYNIRHVNHFVKTVKRGDNAWKANVILKHEKSTEIPKTDVKKCLGILNKISEDNYDKLLSQLKLLDYVHIEIVTCIFNKASNEPKYINLYVRLIKDLTKLRVNFTQMCVETFKNRREQVNTITTSEENAEKMNKMKDLIKFISKLYKEKLIDKIEPFIQILENDPTDNDTILICRFVEIFDPVFIQKTQEYEKIKDILISKKESNVSRVRLNIINILEKFNLV